MFNLDNIDYIKTDEAHGYRSYSFVGIKRNESNDRLEFWLPLGFDEFEETFDNTKDFFFKMYKTFKVYIDRNNSEFEFDELTKDRDGIIEQENGFDFNNENKSQVIFYGKLNAIDKILEGYDELKISSFLKKYQRSQEIDYSKIYRYLHHAIFLVEDDIIYLDEMNIAKDAFIKDTHPILQLFCFIYLEIKTELGEVESIKTRVLDLADEFKGNYLSPSTSLFSEESFDDTLNILKDTLEEIDLKTAFKDEDYWHFFEAVESFLYGERDEEEDGIYWGFSSFYDIWEDMCQCYFLSPNNTSEEILFADVKGKLINFKNIDPNPFQLRLNNLQPRYIRPDLVLEKIDQPPKLYYSNPVVKNGRQAYSIVFHDYEKLRNQFPRIFSKYKQVVNEEDNYLRPGSKYFFIYKDDFESFQKIEKQEIEKASTTTIQIIDYKYMRIWDYDRYSPYYSDEEGNNKIKEDIHKQLIYEWSVQNNWEKETISEFWIPFYSNDLTNLKEPIRIGNIHFNKSQINVVKVNFKVLQEYYLKHEEI